MKIKLTFINILTLIIAVAGEIGFSELVLKYLVEGFIQQNSQTIDRRSLKNEYDFIIVGAGSAGCVLANRLSENPNWNILLIEAGQDELFFMDIPLLANMLQFTNINWRYKSSPSQTHCLGLKNKRCNLPRGKVIGGSTVLNYMIMTRGNRKDYDGWASLGNPGWSYNEILPYFMKSEDMKIDNLAENTKYHNRGGYMSVTYAPVHTPLGKGFINSGIELGYNEIDYNGESQIGFSFNQINMINGTRCSSSKAFLNPVRHRKNLHVKKLSHVTKVLINTQSKRAYGIQFLHNNKKYEVHATKEVILSAGAINSPQILMLSGVGPENHLNKHGIHVIQDLPVGFNLQDHVGLGGLTFLINQTVSIQTERLLNNVNQLYSFLRYHSGYPSIPGGAEALAFIKTDNAILDDYPDLELLLISGTLASEPTLKVNFGLTDYVYNSAYKPLEEKDGYMIIPIILRPKSKGRIKLKNSNPLNPPLIDLGYFSNKLDMDVFIKGVELAIKLSQTDSLKKFNSTLSTFKIPQCKKYDIQTRKYWECHGRHMSFTIYHQCCTCKMSPENDTTSVVNNRLQVRGIKNLRIVDASIMPFVPAAHTNAPTMMIAEKASDIIKEDYG